MSCKFKASSKINLLTKLSTNSNPPKKLPFNEDAVVEGWFALVKRKQHLPVWKWMIPQLFPAVRFGTALFHLEIHSGGC